MSIAEFKLAKRKILFFNLKTEPFKVMVTGEKNEEYRKIGKWMNSRVYNKDGSERKYDFVKFVLGMGSDKPFFVCRFEGVKKVDRFNKTYSSGHQVTFENEQYAVMLGEVLKKGNLEHSYLQ